MEKYDRPDARFGQGSAVTGHRLGPLVRFWRSSRQLRDAEPVAGIFAGQLIVLEIVLDWHGSWSYPIQGASCNGSAQRMIGAGGGGGFEGGAD